METATRSLSWVCDRGGRLGRQSVSPVLFFTQVPAGLESSHLTDVSEPLGFGVLEWYIQTQGAVYLSHSVPHLFMLSAT